jgi:hypothetical protein
VTDSLRVSAELIEKLAAEIGANEPTVKASDVRSLLLSAAANLGENTSRICASDAKLARDAMLTPAQLSDTLDALDVRGAIIHAQDDDALPEGFHLHPAIGWRGDAFRHREAIARHPQGLILD